MARQQGDTVADLWRRVNASIRTGENTINVRVKVRAGSGKCVGRVIRISDKFVSDPPDGEDVFSSVTTNVKAKVSLADIWRQAGHQISDDDAKRTRQVIVHFSDSSTKHYAYPGK